MEEARLRSCLAALKTYWHFINSTIFGALVDLAKLVGIDYVVRNMLSMARGRSFNEMYDAYNGLTHGRERPTTLADYLREVGKIFESITGILREVGLSTSSISVSEKNGTVIVEVSNAVPTMGTIADEESRKLALAISIGIMLGFVESVTGKRTGLRIPQMGVEQVTPEDELVLEVVNFDVGGNRYVAKIEPKK